MTTQTRLIDAPASRSLIAALVLIFGLLASAVAVESSTDATATATMAEWGD